MIKPIAILLTLAGVVSVTEGEAQTVSYRIGAPASSGTSSYSSYYSGPVRLSQPTRVYSYSYYTLSPYPPRSYVGYGAHDFPFYGVPYGHPYDPWTWPMMSSSYANGLARYYDPPVK